MSPSISTTSSIHFFFLFNTFFPTTSKLFPTHCAHVCMYVCLSECVLEVRFGAEAIKALLKYKQKESEKKRSETVREGAHTQWLRWPAQQSAGSLSILWAQRCEMSQQPNSNIKLSWAAEGKSRMEKCLLLTLSPSPDLHSSKPFKNRTLLHTCTHTVPTYTPQNTRRVALLKFWPAAELHLERFSRI